MDDDAKKVAMKFVEGINESLRYGAKAHVENTLGEIVLKMLKNGNPITSTDLIKEAGRLREQECNPNKAGISVKFAMYEALIERLQRL